MMKTDPHHLVEELNRRLKFRVWDKLNQNFIYSDKNYQGHYILSLDGKFHNLQNGSGGEEYDVQQSTGFRDSNGKDLYEGDIIDLTWGGRTNKCVIKFKHGSFIAEYVDPESTMSFHWLHSVKVYDCPVKIIGNIYEKETKLEEKNS